MADAKPYLDYLDKEMTIMGILSAFPVAVAAAATTRVVPGGEHGLDMTVSPAAPCFFLLGTVLQLFAALSFYRQRSLLPWYFGQLSLRLARTEEPNDLLADADSWATWIQHRIGFAALVAGLYEYGVLLHLLWKSCCSGPCCTASPTMVFWLVGLLPVALAACFLIPWWLILFHPRLSYEDHPVFLFLRAKGKCAIFRSSLRAMICETSEERRKSVGRGKGGTDEAR